MIPDLIPWGSENIICTTRRLLNLLRFVLWPRIWLILERVLEQDIYSAIPGGRFCRCHLGQFGWYFLAQVLFIFADFLSTCFTNFRKEVLGISSCNCELIYFSLQVYHFSLPIFETLLLRDYTFRIAGPLYHCKMTWLLWGRPLLWSLLLSDIKVVTAASLTSVSTSVSFLLLLTNYQVMLCGVAKQTDCKWPKSCSLGLFLK